MSIQRVVFDTSTLVSAALRPGSIPHQALLFALRFCDVYASEETLRELKRVLAREKFRRYAPDEVRSRFARAIESSIRLCDTRDLAPALNPVCRDSADHKFLALAFECEADVIVSSDEDLLVLHPWNEIRILRPADFLNEDR